MRYFQQAPSLLPRSAPAERRGVLLVVVLSMLALFLLLGTAFLMTSSFFEEVATEGAKKDRTANDRTDLADRAVRQVIRGTNNPNSPLSGDESLLGDVYGSDGFEARVFVPPDDSLVGLMPQYAGATLPNSPDQLGVTRGQFIDIYVQDLDWRSMVTNDNLVRAFPQPDPRHVIKLHRAPTGETIDHALEAATGYHNGSLLTFTSGPARGQTARIVDYRYVGNTTGAIEANGQVVPVQNRPVWRIRLVAVSRTDGAPLALWGNANPSRAREIRDLVDDPNTYLGAKFVVNGRPFNGTGPGFNPLAQPGTPRLNAVELMQLPSGVVGAEIALMPNRRFVDVDRVGMFLGNGDPFQVTGATVNNFQSLNPPGGGSQGIGLYTTPEGPGGSDESYDAVDYLNMFLARVPIYPQARAGVLDASGISYPMDSPEGQQLVASGDPMRCDLESMVIPSFHRPALINFWQHRVLNSPWLANEIPNESLRAMAAMQPYGPNGRRGDGDDPQVSLAIRDQLAALKRKIIMRPAIEDHPDFDGSNASSRAPLPSDVAISGLIRVPGWETTGPWDVDNDNDSIPDSIWLDLGDTVRETEEGQLYKPLYAFLVVDLDGRLNLNAHGSIEHLTATPYDPMMVASAGNVGNLANGVSSNLMPQGMGYGPAEITLRRILSPNLPFTAPAQVGNPDYDDYARLFAGRPPLGPNDSTNRIGESLFGRLGSAVLTGEVRPGRTFDSTNLINREPLVPFENVGLPVTDPLRALRLAQAAGPGSPWWGFARPTAYGSSPDLKGKYSVGVDYTGQPVYESVFDPGTGIPANPNTWTFVPLVDDSAYETDLSGSGRRGPPRLDAVRMVGNATPLDDAPFDTAEMERLLRAHDPETGTAPSRLWELVDAFDPQKYAGAFDGNPGNTVGIGELALAEVITAANRQQVTTDSYEIPAPSEVVPSYITELGPDGMPGNAGVDDDGEQTNSTDGIDDVTPFDPATGIGEIGWFETQDPADRSAGLFLTGWSDDFASLTGKSVSQARLVDVLWYRIQRNRVERGLPPFNFNNAAAVAELNSITSQLLPPEVIAGYKMDLNRPFGDGRDNNGNGVVDEPIEAGEPYWDRNNNGRWDPDEPFIDLDGNGQFYGDTDGDGSIEVGPGGDDLIPIDDNGDGTPDRFENPYDSLWADYVGGSGAVVDSVFSTELTSPLYVDANGNGVHDPNETVRNLINARQLYARHLYVMMLLMMDEDYVAPYDPTDPQVTRYIRSKGRELRQANPSLTKEVSELYAQRKYTYRLVAQWAANSVDFRDSDATMTAFEYDENPWDGWGNIDTNGTPLDVSDDVYYPLDGDPATDENHRQRIDWQAMANQQNQNGRKLIAPQVASIGPNGNRLVAADANRNVVWGSERPELLITETFAVHDMRLEDLRTQNTEGGDNTTYDDDPPDTPRDDDLDQRLRPRGSAFFELYNPWSPDTPGPMELYSRLERNAAGQIADVNGNGRIDVIATNGIELNRLSTLADSTGKRSPVWRMIVVEEEPQYRNPRGRDNNPTTRDNNQSHRLQNDLPEYFEVQQAGAFKPTDVDWDEMLTRTATAGGNQIRWPMRYWQQENSDNELVNATDPSNEDSSFNRQLFAKPYPYIEREFYFGSNDSFWAYRRENGALVDATNSPQTLGRTYTDLGIPQMREVYQDHLRVRIPFNYVKIQDQQRRSLSFRFLATPRIGQGAGGNRRDVAIASVMPGRYAVLGSAGTAYHSPEFNIDLRLAEPQDADPRPRFMTTLGRIVRGDRGNPQTVARTVPEQHLRSLQGTRRIELSPSPDPNEHQVLVASNGSRLRPADPVGARHNELFVTEAGVRNFSDYDDGAGGNPDGEIEVESPVVAPAVAIPVEDFNVSQPVYGYEVRERELDELEREAVGAGPVWDPRADGGEGAYTNAQQQEDHYDTPFDVEPELREEGSVPNYRVIHLQRLADPSLPWNPPPDHNNWDPERPNQHDPNLPINPYRTVDTAMCDLTVFNGTSSSERPPQAPHNMFRSKERGADAVAAVGTNDAMPLRALWRQERASTEEQWRQQPRPRNRRTEVVDQGVETREHIFENHYDYVMQHTLGFANSSFGDLYLRQEVVPGTPAVRDPTDFDNNIATLGRATGAPRPSQQTTSTYPWLTWNNRPFVSQNELLQVPAQSSANMLWYFSTYNSATTVGNQINGYFGQEARDNNNMFLADPTATPPDSKNTNAARMLTNIAPFGHLLNMFQSSARRAQVFDGATTAKVPVGAPNYHRVLDYVHVPSRYTQTKSMLNPAIFQASGVTDPNDPRRGMLAPFNFVPEYREPGKVNLNTIIEQRLPADGVTSQMPQVWSDVYDGLMHRVQDRDPTGGLGHFGPALRDVVRSRRGYPDTVFGTHHASGHDATSMVMHPQVPTFFANPFRSPEAGDLVPLASLVQPGVEATMLRSHPFRPGNGFAWGASGNDDGDLLVNETGEAGFGDDGGAGAQVPLFGELASTPAVDGRRNAGMHYMPLTRMGNLTTQRSGVFAVWVTVGYFEVKPAPAVDWTGSGSDANAIATAEKFVNQAGGDVQRAMRLYNKVYPQGYQLGKELGIDRGEVERNRSFYIIDRTRPVGYKPGDDLNTEKAILLRRRID